ncbi:hypothetical protein [Blastococcus capsensis]|uniref:hypothetical protein n=1 Tax=Blastococcus capsensis TaxID=1564163 RepID=UPI0025407C75|nr:hypothetical protein [Blastococcus capsensis]
MDGSPGDDRPRFRRLANLATSCFDSCFEGLETEYVGKVNTALWSRPRNQAYTVVPEQNDRDDTIVTVGRALDPTELLDRGDDEVLAALLDIHLDALRQLAQQRGWSSEPFSRAADCVRRGGWEAQASIPEKVNRFSKDLVAWAGGLIDASGGRIYLAVRDQSSGVELQRVEQDVPADWHGLRAALHKVAWIDARTVELQPRQRAGVDLGPRLQINLFA